VTCVLTHRGLASGQCLVASGGGYNNRRVGRGSLEVRTLIFAKALVGLCGMLAVVCRYFESVARASAAKCRTEGFTFTGG
jgi:hypothetical protein